MNDATAQQILRRLPGVDALLQSEPIQSALERYPRKLVADAIREVLEQKRSRLLAHPETAPEADLSTPHLIGLVLERLAALERFTLRPVVNGTGVVIHTNLGRSLLAPEVIEHLAAMCGTYNNLEYDLDHGRRGSRYVHAEGILREITGAEAALVVNNNAGAVLLMLNTLARGKEVVVSRGQLVEIGGSFRIPDVMTASGAILREVGCTNRTHVADYQNAVSDQTALLMKVHHSNYRIIGFTAEVSTEQLVALGRALGLPVVEDLGSGCFVDLSPFGLESEPTAQEALAAGLDAVTFSGDKLLGGPQAGIILGRKDIIDRCKRNPLTRALRVDKMTLAALEATLRLYRDEREAFARIPTLAMIAVPASTLEQRARQLAESIREADPGLGLEVDVQPSVSRVGGGSLPAHDLPTFTAAVRSKVLSAHGIERRLRANTPPVIGRIEADTYLLDLRTIRAEEHRIIADAFQRLAEATEKEKEPEDMGD